MDGRGASVWSVGEWGGSGGVVAGLTERRTMVAIHVGTVVMALWLVRDGGSCVLVVLHPRHASAQRGCCTIPQLQSYQRQ